MKAVAWVGEIFLNALKMLVIPLIISSLIVGISGLGDITKVGKTGVITLVYFMATTAFSVVIGLFMVNLLKPGESVEMISEVPEGVAAKQGMGITDILQSFVSPNLIKSMLEMDILPIIIFSLVFGAVLTTLGEKGKSVISFFDAVNEAIMKMVHLVLYFAPIGTFALIASNLGAAGGGDAFWEELMKIGKYAFTVLAALLFHALVVLPAQLLCRLPSNAPKRIMACRAGLLCLSCRLVRRLIWTAPPCTKRLRPSSSLKCWEFTWDLPSRLLYLLPQPWPLLEPQASRRQDW
jgi:Na+/H+-dicarboxylate symporter